MDQTERQIIDDLFGKLREAEARSGPRDPEAEAYIRDHVARQPAAPYLMAQATVMLEQALAAEQARTRDLEQQLRERPAAGGGLFGGLFGGGAEPSARPGGSPWSPQARPPVVPGDPRVAAYANPHHRHGGGFMAGAMQTAVGVAGGMLLGSALGSMFAGDAAAAEPPPEEPTPEEESDWDSGSDFGDEEF